MSIALSHFTLCNVLLNKFVVFITTQYIIIIPCSVCLLYYYKTYFIIVIDIVIKKYINMSFSTIKNTAPYIFPCLLGLLYFLHRRPYSALFNVIIAFVTSHSMHCICILQCSTHHFDQRA